jgi:hypothetical protein
MQEHAAPDAPASRALRLWYAVIQGVAVAVFVTLCWFARKFEEIFEQLGMKDLPLPTEALVALARFVRTPAGSVLMAAGGATLVLLGLRGTLDRVLRKLIVGNVVGVFFLVAFYVQSLFIPIMKIQEALKDK